MPALPRNVYRTPHGFQFRMVVPEPLRGLIGQREIKKALGKDYRQAVSQARVLAVEVDQRFTEARERRARERTEDDALQAFLAKTPNQRLKRVTRITPEFREGLKSFWLLTLEEDLAARRAGLDEDEFEETDGAVTEMERRIASAIARGQPRDFLPVLDQLARFKGYELVLSSEEERALVLDLLPTFQQVNDILAQRQKGRLVEPDLSQAAPPLRAAWEPPEAEGQHVGMSWSALFEHWKQDRTRAQSTVDDVAWVVRSVSELFPGSTPAALKRAQVSEWLRHVRATHGNGSSTLKKKGELLGAMYSSAVKDELLEYNPVTSYDFSRFASREGIEDPEERYPFSLEQLQRVFSTQEGVFDRPHLGGGGGYYAHVWYSLLGLYTGARLDEVGQLTTSDVLEDPVPHIKIRRGKTRSSVREVPLHPTLVELGFLDYVHAIRAAGYASLWPFLRTRSEKHKPSAVFGKWFNRLLHTKLGMSSHFTEHSLRHTFKDLCRDAMISHEIHEAFTGHAKKSVGDTYGKGFSIEVKHRELSKIHIDLDVPRPHPFTGSISPRAEVSPADS